MANIEMQELILFNMTKPREVNVECHKHLKMSEHDGFMFGFLLRLGFCLYFLCILDRFKGKDGKKYQVGYMSLKVKNGMLLDNFTKLCEKRGYRYCLVDGHPWIW